MKRLKRLLKKAEDSMIAEQKLAKRFGRGRLCDKKTRQSIRKYLGLED